jgi:hypothetical protein
MNRPIFKRLFPEAVVWTALVVLCGAIALAQESQESGAAPPLAATDARTDGQIEMDVVHALDASQTLKNDLITAATIQSEVTLSGTVSSDSSRKLAESIAAQVPGVTKVYNNLKVGNPQEAPSAEDQQTDNSQADNTGEPAPPPGDQQQPAPGPPQEQSQAYPPAQPPYAPAQPSYPQPPAYEAPNGPVTIPPGTLLQLRTSEPVGSKRARDGEPVQFTVIQDIAVGGVLAIPRGATVHGVVTEAKKAGRMEGSPELALTLTSLDLGGRIYPLETDQFKVKGPNKAGETARRAFGGALLGALIGGAADGGVGAGIGAAAGAGAGTAASAASGGPGAWIPAEALVAFHLRTPLTVAPVSAQEADRLAEGLYQGGPNLYRRGRSPYGRPYPGYPYGYPPVYYRPYYAVGGYYYWR